MQFFYYYFFIFFFLVCMCERIYCLQVDAVQSVDLFKQNNNNNRYINEAN